MLLKKFAVGATLSLVCALSTAETVPGLNVQLGAGKTMINAQGDVTVIVAVTNQSRAPIDVLKWALPGGGYQGQYFAVTRDGAPVQYTGAIYKRVAPTAADYIRIAPGQTITREVELSGDYDMNSGGHYSIELASYSAHMTGTANPRSTAQQDMNFAGSSDAAAQASRTAGTLRSPTINVWVEHSAANPASSFKQSMVTPLVAGGGGITYTGSCSSSRKTALASAVTSATTYTNNANNYLAGISSSTQRFAKWFGTYSAANRDQVKGHYSKSNSAFNTQPLTLDCSCTATDTYAYVYPSQPYKIYVCGAFWSAPATGTDSKAGTLVHEMTHFTVNGGTQDYAYGQSAAASLAISDPAKARQNADSHEYFAENTPSLP